jgi:predicted nucleic acid-binding protein
VRFWDSSAIVPLIVAEREHAAARAEFERDPDLVAWWATPIECVSALARREREGGLALESVVGALRRLDGLASAWQEVQPAARVRQAAIRVLRVHPLRAADALQLAAALAAAEDYPETLPFVTFDDRLAQAAAREGFAVIVPQAPN